MRLAGACMGVVLLLISVSRGYAVGIGESVTIPQSGVFLSDGFGGPLPSSLQIAQLGTLITSGFNQETVVLGMLLQEVAKKSLDSEALLKGIGEYMKTAELFLKDLQKNALLQTRAYENAHEELFGSTPFSCSDALTAEAMKEAKKSMRSFSEEMKHAHVQKGEGTQATEMRAEAMAARALLSIMQEEMTQGNPDEQKIPSSASMFPFSGVISRDGARVFQAVISSVNSEPMPVIRNSESVSGKRALELQGIKLGRLAGIHEGLQIAFDLQNAVINGQAFSQMQAELNSEVKRTSLGQEDYIEAGYNDSTGAISVLQALTHQFERARVANPDWYTKIDHGGMTIQGLLRELVKMEAWRGYMESLALRINMVNAYNIAQQAAMQMERHDNARMISHVYPNGDSPTKAP